MLQQHHVSNQSKLSWPNECQTILKLSPLLLAGMSVNRSTLHHLIRSNGDLNSESVDVSSITAEKLLSLRKESRKRDIGHKLQQSERTVVHSKKLHEELLLPPIPQVKNTVQEQEPLAVDDSVVKKNHTPPVSMRLSNKLTSKNESLKISDCMYTFDVQDLKEVPVDKFFAHVLGFIIVIKDDELIDLFGLIDDGL